MELVLVFLLPYLISMAANERSAAVNKARESKLKKVLADHEALERAIASRRPLSDEVAAACAQVARHHDVAGVTSQEAPLWRLLSDTNFQSDLTEWLMAGAIEEGAAAREKLIARMDEALKSGTASPQQREFLRSRYFEEVEKTVFMHPILVQWRHQLSLNYLRQQVATLQKLAEENAGRYSEDKQRACMEIYCANALAEWDIIDLSNLPEGDVHIATQKLLLRQLYMPLRVSVEKQAEEGNEDSPLVSLEEERSSRRKWAAFGASDWKMTTSDETDKNRRSIGEVLETSNRLVVLGDPGGGKTTMLRWIATSYLLRGRGDPSFAHIPDTATLPTRDLLPVLIRCRDLGDADLCRSFSDFLAEHLKKSHLKPDEAKVVLALILERFSHGSALLLVDGLDEITNPKVRVLFCQEVERTAARYPEARILVTSRIVGYRDMPYRMGVGFLHAVIAELNSEDKDRFAGRWIELTEQHQSSQERDKRYRELIDALHSSDRIERLTGNPMLLTTLALVKRKVGKLPNRRTKLYAEAVAVLLNWNPRLYSTLEEDEAIPQLEYLAYEMCRRGVQRLTDDEVLDLLDRLRVEYPNIRAVKKRDPHAFLTLLEERSSILIRSGGIWQKGKSHEKPVWEFRHLTFQEYLAARALLDGRYPGRDKTLSLARQVGPLAVSFAKDGEVQQSVFNAEEAEVPESWREAIRLLVADCKDDDVDDVLLAVLNPPATEPPQTARPRAALATLCLADEPNISEECARAVLVALAHCVNGEDGKGSGGESIVDAAALSLKDSIWLPLLKIMLVEEYSKRGLDRWNVGGLWSMVEVEARSRRGTIDVANFEDAVRRLKSKNTVEEISAALLIMGAAFSKKLVLVEGLTEGLVNLLVGSQHAVRHAAAWACGWMMGGSKGSAIEQVWTPTQQEAATLVGALATTPESEVDTRRWLIWALGGTGREAVPAVMGELNSLDKEVRKTAVNVLEKLNDSRAVRVLIPLLGDHEPDVVLATIEALRHFNATGCAPGLVDLVIHADGAVFRAAVNALMYLRDTTALPLLAPHLGGRNDHQIAAAVIYAYLQPDGSESILSRKPFSTSATMRRKVMAEIAKHRDRLDRRLLSTEGSRYRDPNSSIAPEEIASLAKLLKLTEDEIFQRFAAIATAFKLPLRLANVPLNKS